MAAQTRTAAGRLVNALVREQVRYVFSVSGSSILPIFDAAMDAPLEIVHARQEWGASFMAEGWGRVTGEPGVCLVTLGPGVANCTNAAMTALLDSVPLVILGGRAPTRAWDRDGFGDIDTRALMRPVTKAAHTVTDPNRVGEYIHLAFQQARSGRPGPVYVEVPNDVLNMEAGAERAVATPRRFERPLGAPADVRAAADLLRGAARPILVAGTGARMGGAGARLAAFAEAQGIPVFGARLGRGLVPLDSPINAGIAIIGTNPVLRRALKEADALLLLGARLEFDLEFGAADFFPPGLKTITVDVDGSWIGRNRPTDVGVVGDAGLVLGQLAEALAGDDGGA